MVQLKTIDDNCLELVHEPPMLTRATVFTHPQLLVEDEALQQLRDAASIDPDAIVLATPDIHSGYGVPIGCVWASPHFISPSAVGYDINCGMRLLTTPANAADVDISALAHSIHRDVPLGEGQSNVKAHSHKTLLRLMAEGVPAVGDLVHGNQRFAAAFNADELRADLLRIEDGGCLPADPAHVPDRALERGSTQFGTLGGGNHFIEFQRVERIDDPVLAKAWGLWLGQLVVMIHSGSRGLGHEIGGHYMKAALADCQRSQRFLPSTQLAYLPLDSRLGIAYRHAMNCAANFAYANRQIMATFLRHNLRHALGTTQPLPLLYDVAHNIAKFETAPNGVRYCVHRKGATRAFPPSRMPGTPFAKTGQPVLIPGSMGTASYLLVGVESGGRSLFSVNHGAGRVLSRTAASGRGRKGRITEAAVSDRDFHESMRGITLICQDKRRIKEEAPQAYKDIDLVIEAVTRAALARTVARFKPLAVLKG